MKHPETILQHFAEEEHLHGAVVPPVFQNSLFLHETCASLEKALDFTSTDNGFLYSRFDNPTLEIVEKKLAALEHTDRCKLFSGGVAAITAAVMHSVRTGSHVVCVDTVYNPTRQLLEEYLPKFGISSTFVPGTDTEELLDAVQENTSLIFLESPSTWLYQIQDLEAIGSFARGKGITTVIDNSYATPLHQNPIDFGIDIVVHSATKYLAGHSDLTAGAICCNEQRMKQIMTNEVAMLGAVLAPWPAWLLLRGMRTLSLRMAAAEKVGNQVANFLQARDEVSEVFHCGLESHPQRDTIRKQMRGTGALLTFEPVCQDPDKVKAFVDRLQLFHIGVSWGGFESLALTMQWHPIGWAEPRQLVRLYCGLENPEDLLGDLDQAFKVLNA